MRNLKIFTKSSKSSCSFLCVSINVNIYTVVTQKCEHIAKKRTDVFEKHVNSTAHLLALWVVNAVAVANRDACNELMDINRAVAAKMFQE